MAATPDEVPLSPRIVCAPAGGSLRCAARLQHAHLAALTPYPKRCLCPSRVPYGLVRRPRYPCHPALSPANSRHDHHLSRSWGAGVPGARLLFIWRLAASCRLPSAILLSSDPRLRPCLGRLATHSHSVTIGHQVRIYVPTYLQTANPGLHRCCCCCTVQKAVLTVRSTRCSCQTARPRELADRLTDCLAD